MGRVGLQIELRGESRTGFSRSPIYILKISDCSEEKPSKGHRSKYAIVEVRGDRSLDRWLP